MTFVISMTALGVFTICENKFFHFDRMIASTMKDQRRKPGIGFARTHQRQPVSECREPHPQRLGTTDIQLGIIVGNPT